MRIEKAIEESRIRAENGKRLVIFLGLVMALGFSLRLHGLAKIIGAIAVYMAFMSASEYWNLRRLRRFLEKPKDTADLLRRK